MFLDFYNLREQPFGVTPNPAFLYLSHSHREALASLFYAVENERGFAALIAPPGMGKTTLLFHMLEKLRPSSHTAFLFQTQCDSSQLLRYLLADLGCPTEERDLVKLHFELNEILVREARAGRRLVVVIDEAQDLDESVLETLRLLSDFETPNRKLMQIVLAGQPLLGEKLARPELIQLLQRFYILSRLAPFNPEETHAYVEHRLKVVGYEGKPLFQPEAFGLIASHCQGIPRVINNLCFHSMTLGFAKKQRTIDAATVRNALADLNLQQASTTVELSASFGGPSSWRAELCDAGLNYRPDSALEGLSSAKANDRGFPADSTAASSWTQWVSAIRSPRDEQLPSPGGVAATQPGWVKNTPLLAQEGVGGGPPQTETTSANPEMAVKLPSLGGVAAAQPGWVDDSNAHGRLSSANPRGSNESSGLVELGPPDQIMNSRLPAPQRGRGVGGEGDHTPVEGCAFGGLSSAKPVVSSPASSRSWSLTYPGLAACLALALLACFGYISYQAGIPAPEFGWLQPKVTVSTQASFIPTSTPSKENISVEQVPASPNQNGLAELRPPASSSQGGIQTSQLPSPGGVAATQSGWAEQAPLLAQEGAGGGPGRSEGYLVVVAPNQTLCQICLQYLGRYSLSLVDEIVQLNPRLKDPNFIMAGQRLRLPVKSEQHSEPTLKKVEPSTAVAQKH